MKRTTGIYGMLLAAALTLSACSGSPPESSEESSPAEAPAASLPAPSDASPAPSSPQAGSETYTDEELTELVSSLEDEQGQALTVVPAAQLDQGLAQSKQLLESATITPEACRVLAMQELQVPEGSAYAAGASQSTEEQTQTTITVLSVPDPEAIAEQLSVSQDAVQECSSYEIEVEGQTISSEIEPMEVETEGDMSFGAVITQTLENGETQTIMSVSGLRGTLAATALKIGAEVPQEAQGELVDLVNAALAEGE